MKEYCAYVFHSTYAIPIESNQIHDLGETFWKNTKMGVWLKEYAKETRTAVEPNKELFGSLIYFYATLTDEDVMLYRINFGKDI